MIDSLCVLTLLRSDIAIVTPEIRATPDASMKLNTTPPMSIPMPAYAGASHQSDGLACRQGSCSIEFPQTIEMIDPPMQTIKNKATGAGGI